MWNVMHQDSYGVEHLSFAYKFDLELVTHVALEMEYKHGFSSNVVWVERKDSR